ncbi:hypothetical protein [Streptomyces sp. CA-132043]|uniref:hypothetical protein n=1 Tax=Streptomyces sp. CA-132043 TaxID=3240048 RepID=UPI003D8E81C7
MPITVTPATGSRGRPRAGVRARRAVLASVLAAAAMSLTACRGDGTGVRPIPESSAPSSSASPSSQSSSTSDGRTPVSPTSVRPTPAPRTPELPTALPTSPPTAPPTAAATEPYRP